ncbi:hypothetical protein [Rhodococcus sp. NPDC058521]|uniref:hypothetical protein n=1 Tax=Rhodococcus sp. NPDC058521 TaxID=3346536 RepID=UPI003652A323
MTTESTIGKALATAIAAATLPILAAGVASAGPYDPPPANPDDYLVGDTAYFQFQGHNCAIAPTGDVGCDLGSSMQMTVGDEFFTDVREILLDSSGYAAHPGPGVGTPHTLPAGNRELTGELDYAGASCSPGLKADLRCESNGHTFWVWTPYASGS